MRESRNSAFISYPTHPPSGKEVQRFYSVLILFHLGLDVFGETIVP